jgi:hypothetical protein
MLHPKTKTYGNTLSDLRRASLGGAMLAVFAVVVLSISAYQHGRLNLARDWPAALLLVAVIGGIIPLMVLPTCLFSIRIDDEHITHLFCGRITLKQRPVSRLKSVRVGQGLFAVVFQFTDGSGIHFFGARIRVIDDLCGHLHRLLPDFQGFTFGPRYAFLSRAINKFNPKP